MNTLYEERRPSNQVRKYEKESTAMHAIARFEWLRSREIGMLLWPDAKSAHRKTYGNTLCKSLLEQRFVIQRKLPYQYGFVYVLSKKGADFLSAACQDIAEDGVLLADFERYFSGKNVGKEIDQKPGEDWRPCKAWRHDLLAQGVLIRAWAVAADPILTTCAD